MSDVVNLNKARKARARADAKTQAAENRVRFGRTRAERDAEAARKAKTARELDGKKRD